MFLSVCVCLLLRDFCLPFLWIMISSLHELCHSVLASLMCCMLVGRYVF